MHHSTRDVCFRWHWNFSIVCFFRLQRNSFQKITKRPPSRCRNIAVATRCPLNSLNIEIYISVYFFFCYEYNKQLQRIEIWPIVTVAHITNGTQCLCQFVFFMSKCCKWSENYCHITRKIYFRILFFCSKWHCFAWLFDVSASQLTIAAPGEVRQNLFDFQKEWKKYLIYAKTIGYDDDNVEHVSFIIGNMIFVSIGLLYL